MSKTLIIGANGQIGRLLVDQCSERHHQVRAMVRRDDQRAALEAKGAEVAVGDLEGDFELALDGCDNVIFTAGSGAGTGADKTLLVDLWGAIKSIRACERRGINRFLMVSARRAEDPDSGPEKIRHYLAAKHIADDYLMKSDLGYTILRPGRLLNEPGAGRFADVRPADSEQQVIPREDVAQALVYCLEHAHTIGEVKELYRGERTLEQLFS